MKSTQKKVSGADLPTSLHGFIFGMKAWRLRMLRALTNKRMGVVRHKSGQTPDESQLISKSVSPLWSGEETALMLVAGKIHNLRLAAQRLDGIIVPASQTFSFWKQIGRITRRKGYAQGRELREGCIIPTIGGGICQLSNAIYDAALSAGLEIVERHRHSQVIAGSLAEQDRDATVFWNYLDLRIRASYTWQLRIKMDDKHLSVQILARSEKEQDSHAVTKQLPPAAIGDCTRCGRTDCYLHVGDIPLHQHKTWLVTDEEWSEFTQWRKQNQETHDKIVSSSDFRIANFYSRLMRRYHLHSGHPLPVAQNSRFSRIAKHLAKKLKASDTYLIVPQDLLVWLWMAGELRGRQYDVLMNALPVSEIQSRLDVAVDIHPQITPLTNFRADASFAQAEQDALAGAFRWITPHAEILKIAGDKGLALSWLLPETTERSSPETIAPESQVPTVMLAAPSLARKGVYELREALHILPLPVRIILPPGKWEAPDMWSGLDVSYAASMSEGLRQADVVVLPAWIEHQPRGLLQAIAEGKPVIASRECGLPDHLQWIPVAVGNVEELKQAILSVIRKE